MKSNIEQFVKYLDGQLDSIEKKSFENELFKNAEFKREFENFKNTFYTVNNDFELNEDYFINLLPNVRERTSTKTFHWNYKYGFIFVMILLFVIYFVIPPTQNNSDIYLSTFETELLNDDELVMSLLELNINDSKDLDLVSEYYSDEIASDEELFEYLHDDLNLDELNDSLLFALSDLEMQTIYDLFIEKKIIGE